ncbi:MAG: response regulator transcription factor [Sphingomonas sp.]|uniref:LuxR C-terminal-related transcriptional regulator n=1 Tax=Sphingomonas sp. TaxID=28214 RepID=UPI001B1283A7|nr:response regulator transcription factor [Sphingomonas sp.]MBO9623909.1 response regulator transcription factor [Sphingomonas sp.]
MKPPIRVALLGHNSIIREGLSRILAEANFNVTQSVDSASRLSDAEDDLLIIVDGGFEGDDAEGITHLREQLPNTKVVLLSETFDLPAMVCAFRAGVHGYIVKEISCEPLIASLRLVAMGEKVMPSNLADVLPLHSGGNLHERDRETLANANLSARELEILTFLIMGCPNKVISRRLSISEATVKVHVKGILRKLCVRNRTQAAIRAVNAGLDSNLDNEDPESGDGADEDEPRGKGKRRVTGRDGQGEMLLPFSSREPEACGDAELRADRFRLGAVRSAAFLMAAAGLQYWNAPGLGWLSA